MSSGSDALSVLLTFVSWSTLPQLISKFALRGLYDVQLIPRPVSPSQAQLHARRVQALAIVGYLFYTVYSSIYRRSPNFYELLGLPLQCDSEDVRKAFRKLARIYHPDKAGGRASDEAFFIVLRHAHDCLADPVKRLAYDRFGTSVLQSKDLTTEREYFARGLQSSLAFYIFHPVSYGFMSWLAGKKIITFWLLTLYVILLASEVSLIFQGVRWNAYGLLPATMTAHDLVNSLHSAYTALLLASTHLGPLLPALRDPNANLAFNHLFDGATSEKDLLGLRDLIDQQETRSMDLRVQSGRNIDMTLLPLRPERKATTQTLQEAANQAARRRAKSMQSAAAQANVSSAPVRQASHVEQAFIHRLSQSILRHRLEVIPAVREAIKRQTQEQKTSSENGYAAKDNTKEREAIQSKDFFESASIDASKVGANSSKVQSDTANAVETETAGLKAKGESLKVKQSN